MRTKGGQPGSIVPGMFNIDEMRALPNERLRLVHDALRRMTTPKQTLHRLDQVEDGAIIDAQTIEADPRDDDA